MARPIDIVALKEGSRELMAIRGGRIGLVFQEPMSSLSPVHTIGSQIIEALRLHRKLDKAGARAEAIELLRQVEIPNPDKMVDRYTFEFSGGMRQRAMIAMALAGNPDILIADEPTTALDVTTQAEILDLIKRLQVSRGMAMLLITHDMGVVAEVADEVAVMRYRPHRRDRQRRRHFPRRPASLYQAIADLDRDASNRPGPAMSSRPQPNAAKPVLSVRNLSKLYGATKGWFGGGNYALKAVDDVSFDLYPGENLGIVGESGSGKTTLGRLILRTVEPTEGKVTYRGREGREIDVTGLDQKEPARLPPPMCAWCSRTPSPRSIRA